MLALAEQVVAIELLCATRGIRVRRRQQDARLGVGTTPVFAAIEGAMNGETPSEDIARIVASIRDGSLVAAAEAAAGPLIRVPHA